MAYMERDMGKRYFIIVCLLLFSTANNADEAKQAYREIANDLANLKASIDNTYQIQSVSTYPRQLTITANNAELLSGAGDDSKAIANATKGSTYHVLDKTSNWYAVALDKEVAGQSAAWVNASNVAPVNTLATSPSQQKSYADKLYEEILEKVNNFKEKYKNNPYVTVTGFSVNIGVPPSVSVSFEFKE